MPGDNKLTDEWPAEAKFAVAGNRCAFRRLNSVSIAAARGSTLSRSSNGAARILGQQSARALQQAGEGTVQGGQEAHPATRARVVVKTRPWPRRQLLILQKSSMPTGATSTRPIDPLPERQQYVAWWREALAGARKHPAAEVLGLSLRTLQRWLAEPELSADGRPDAVRPTPAHALSPEERQAVLDVCNSQEFASLPLSQIVPRLADQGRYLASESSFYRILRAADQQHRRGRSQPPRHVPAPTSHAATGPNQVWSWDITHLPSLVRGQYYYLYLIEDIYSRKGVGWEAHEQECGEQAAALLQRSVIREQCWKQPLVLHFGQRRADEVGHAADQDV